MQESERQDFEEMHERLVREHFGGAVVALPDLITFTEQLLAEAEAGDVPHRGKIHHIAPAALDPTADAVIQAGARRPTGRTRWLAGAFIIGGPLLLGWLLLGVLFPAAPAATSTSRTPLPAPATVAAAPANTTPTALPAPTVATGFVTVAGQQLPAVRPTTLDLAGRSFLVYVAPVRDGNWQVRQDPTVANWLPGATANWAFALFLDSPDAPDPQPWLGQIQPGTRVTLRVTSDSRPHQFRITARQTIARTQTEFLDPHKPGLTIAIKISPDADTRLLVQGQEEIAAAPPSPTGNLSPGGVSPTPAEGR